MSLVKLSVAPSQLLNLHACAGLGVPITVSALTHSSFQPGWMVFQIREIHSKISGSIFMVQIMQQSNSTKTNLEKADASAEKWNEGQEGSGGSRNKPAFPSVRRGAAPQGEPEAGARNSWLSSYQSNPDSWECSEDWVFRLSTTVQTEFFWVVTKIN